MSSAAVAAADAEMQRRGVPGSSIAFIEDGEVSALVSLGVRSVVDGAPVTDDTVFEGASHGKPLFAYAVMRLADAGVVVLDEPIGGTFDGVDLGTITPRMILSHTAGLANWRVGEDEPALTGSAPGTSFAYSGSGYVVLQHAMEARLGRPLDDVMREIVYEPLGLRDTSYLWRTSYDDRFAQGHDEAGRPLEKWRPGSVASAASGVHTTARDLATVLAAVLEPSAINRTMLRPAVVVEEDWGGGPPRDTSWALGWGVSVVDRDAHAWHWGWNDGFKSFSTASIARRRGVVVLTNSDDGLWVCRAVVRELLGAEHPAFAWLGHA